MGKKHPKDGTRQSSEIDEEIARTKAEIDAEYHLLGKTVCELADQEAGKIGKLVDKLVGLKMRRNAQNTERSKDNEIG